MAPNDSEETDALISSSNSTESPGYGTNNRFLVPTEESINNGDARQLTVDGAIETAGFGKFHFLLVMFMGWGLSSDSIEIFSIAFVLPIASCEMHATDIQLGYLSAMGYAGMMLGSYVWCTISDVKGRIKVLTLCQAFNALFIIGSCLTQNIWVLMVMRLFSGFGVGGTSPLIFVYTVELLPAKHRGKMVAGLSAFFTLGQILVAGMAWVIIPQTEWSSTTNGFTFNSWRIFLLASGTPAITSTLMFMWLPESPRYLIKMEKVAEARKVLKYIYKWNGYTEPYQDNYYVMQTGETCYHRGIWSSLKLMLKNTWSLVAKANIRHRFIYSSIIYFCLSFSTNGLNMWFPTLLERMEANNASSVCDTILPAVNSTKCDHTYDSITYSVPFYQALSTIPANIINLLFIDVIGRKLMTGVSMILTGLSVFFIWYISSRISSFIFACIFSAISVISWNALGLVTAEIFPTQYRSSAKGVQSALCNRVPAITASILFGALMSTYCVVPILLIVCLLGLGGMLTYTLPDTTKLAIS